MTVQTSSVENIRKALDATVEPHFEMCGCMGPQGDQPLCPCMMQNVIRWRGHWIKMEKIEAGKPSSSYLDDLKNNTTL